MSVTGVRSAFNYAVFAVAAYRTVLSFAGFTGESKATSAQSAVDSPVKPANDKTV